MQNIATPSYAHRQMSPDLQLVADLMGGTRTMRQAGLRWLPREAAESWQAWRARLNRTFLFNAYARTIQTLSGIPFAQPVHIEQQHPKLKKLAANMDGQGCGIHSFCGQVLSALLQDGMVHIQLDSHRMVAIYIVSFGEQLRCFTPRMVRICGLQKFGSQKRCLLCTEMQNIQ